MCMSQSFETPQQKYDRAKHSDNTSSRKHSPNFENVHWNKEGLLEKLKNWPKDISINWSELAWEFNIPGSNKGQVAKEFAIHNGLDVFSLDKRPKSTRIRARKLRMPGGEISVPTHRTVEGIKEDWTKMIQSGELTLGEPCYPHTITRYSIKDGELKQHEITVYGRKIPLLDLRKKLLLRHEPFMRLHTDEQLLALTKLDLTEYYKKQT